MRILVTGGAASGKSAHAERILCKYTPQDSRLYVATMQPFGQAAAERIARHQTLRAGKGFATSECYINLASFQSIRQYDGILLECMSNLLANEMFSGAGVHAEAAVLEGIQALERQCRVLVIVTNEIFSDGVVYTSETIRYMQTLGRINRVLAAEADAVFESVCGILVPHKGKDLL